MELKEFSINIRVPALLLTLWVAAVIGSCAPRQIIMQPEAPREDAVWPPPAGESVRPQQAAARELTDRGRRHLENLRPDDAIRELERALNLNPSDGETYYLLAEAWLMKIDARRAGEFNRIAEDLFTDDPDWLVRIAQQADRISEMEQ